jgi:hypothetical protein
MLIIHPKLGSPAGEGLPGTADSFCANPADTQQQRPSNHSHGSAAAQGVLVELLRAAAVLLVPPPPPPLLLLLLLSLLLGHTPDEPLFRAPISMQGTAASTAVLTSCFSGGKYR